MGLRVDFASKVVIFTKNLNYIYVYIYNSKYGETLENVYKRKEEELGTPIGCVDMKQGRRES